MRAGRFGLVAAVGIVGLLLVVIGVRLVNEPVDPLVRLARDLSGDPAVIARVEAIVRDPPATLEEVGFYGMKDEPPRYRAVLATVFRLDQAGALHSVEDKYLPELLDGWIEAGLLDLDQLPPEAQSVFRPMAEYTVWDEETDEPDPAFLATLERNYAAAVRQLEDYFAGRGQMLLNVDATSGDTLHFAILPTAIGERWRNVRLDDRGPYTPGIREPLWDAFWHMLVYAYQLPTVGDTYTRPLPAGVRERVEELPLAR